MADHQLKQALEHYEITLNALTSSVSKYSQKEGLDSLENGILSVLTARDAVQFQISRKAPTCTDSLIKLNHLDNLFKSIETYVAQTSQLEQWKKMLKPQAESWWWFPQKEPHSQDRSDWMWNGMSVLFFTISLGLFTNISTRFFIGGPDAIGAIAIAMQSVLGLLGAKGSLTSVWQEVIEKRLERRGLAKHWQQEIRCGIALLILGGLVFFYYSLPLFSSVYNFLGGEDDANGRLVSAKNNFNRAIILNPDNADAHYNLGRIYEVMQMSEQASSEYQIAAQSGISRAYNNLARIKIIERKYSVAIPLLSGGLKRLKIDERDPEERVEVEYSLRKNFGWARLGEKRYKEAKNQLDKAIKLDGKRAAAYCLLAQVSEAQNQKKEAVGLWKTCLKLSSQELDKVLPQESAQASADRKIRFPSDEDRWVFQAQECLKQEYMFKKCLEDKGISEEKKDQ